MPGGPGPASVSGCPGLDSAKRSSHIRPSGRSPPGSRKNCHSRLGPPPFSGVRRVANDGDARRGWWWRSSVDDDAELLRVGGAEGPFRQRGGDGRDDGDAAFDVVAFEDVREVARRGTPCRDDPLRRGERERAPGEVLADHVADLFVRYVAAGAHAVEIGRA